MKVVMYINGVYISAKKIESTNRDGQKVVSDYVAVESNEEVGNLKCTSDVANTIKSEKKYAEMLFQGVFDTWNKDLVITGYRLKENSSL